MCHIFVEIDQQNGIDIHATIMAKNLHLCKLYSKKKLLDCSTLVMSVRMLVRMKSIQQEVFPTMMLYRPNASQCYVQR